MKTKLFIFVFLLACFGLVMPAVMKAAEPDMGSQVISGKSPSAVTLSRIENLSIASETTNSSMATTYTKLRAPRSVGSWDDIDPPHFEEASPGPVGDPAPIGDVTLPVALFALIIYFVYRGVTTSKRKSNM
jgi:hypothetical protein